VFQNETDAASLREAASISALNFVQPAQLPPPTLAAAPTEVKVAFAFVPSVVMAPMQTTMIKASITAYSTAVGPSSDFRKAINSRAWRISYLY
jgi:hypothetical protein